MPKRKPNKRRNQPNHEYNDEILPKRIRLEEPNESTQQVPIQFKTVDVAANGFSFMDLELPSQAATIPTPNGQSANEFPTIQVRSFTALQAPSVNQQQPILVPCCQNVYCPRLVQMAQNPQQRFRLAHPRMVTAGPGVGQIHVQRVWLPPSGMVQAGPQIQYVISPSFTASLPMDNVVPQVSVPAGGNQASGQAQPSSAVKEEPNPFATHVVDPATGRVKCTICKDTFAKKWDWTQHYNAKHRKPRSYRCQHCFERLATLTKLEAHERTHNTAVKKSGRRLTCGTASCAMSFQEPQDLERHLRECHRVLDLRCERCDQSFVNSCDLQLHTEAMHH